MAETEIDSVKFIVFYISFYRKIEIYINTQIPLALPNKVYI